MRRHAIFLLCLVVGMLATGGFTAGLDGGKIYNTFPLMGGALLPGDLLALEPLWRNPFENPTTAQFIHRWLAMLVALTALTLWVRRERLPEGARRPSIFWAAWWRSRSCSASRPCCWWCRFRWPRCTRPAR